MSDGMTYEGSWQQEVERLRAEVERLKVLLGVVVAYKICPQCGDGRGYTVQATMPDGEPEQVQCQWCDEVGRALDGEEVSDE